MTQNKSGYILILTLMAIALITTIVTKMYYQSSAFLPLSELIINRQKAQSLALGGVQLAVSRLSGSEDQKSKPVNLLNRILPSINRWQTFNLKEEIDGVTGTLKICISCENGKINLNQLYDFQKHGFKDVQKTVTIDSEKSLDVKQVENSKFQNLLQEVFVSLSKLTKNEIDAKNANQALIKFLSARNYQLLDITELLQIPELNYFKKHVFYEPPTSDQKLEDTAKIVYLTDLFTTWTDQIQVEPWLFSDSILALLSFPRAQPNDIMKRDSIVKEWTKNFKEVSNWQSDWDKSLGLVYNVELANLPKIGMSLFETKFNPQVFSVIACGTVGSVTQKVYAIIKLQSESAGSSFFSVEKLYWI